ALINHGTILSAQPSPSEGLGYGVLVDANVTLVNDADGVIIGSECGLRLAGVTTIINHGTVQGFSEAIEGGYGLVELTMAKTGGIGGRSAAITSVTGDFSIHNSGLIEATGFDGIVGQGTMTIVNDIGGVIRGPDQAISQFGDGVLRLDNRGAVIGDMH